MAKNFPGWLAWVILVAGVLYLLADLRIFFTSGSWGINWWTVAFILIGMYYVTNK